MGVVFRSSQQENCNLFSVIHYTRSKKMNTYLLNTRRKFCEIHSNVELGRFSSVWSNQHHCPTIQCYACDDTSVSSLINVEGVVWCSWETRCFPCNTQLLILTSLGQLCQSAIYFPFYLIKSFCITFIHFYWHAFCQRTQKMLYVWLQTPLISLTMEDLSDCSTCTTQQPNFHQILPLTFKKYV